VRSTHGMDVARALNQRADFEICLSSFDIYAPLRI
jgi:hypothetical protein